MASIKEMIESGDRLAAAFAKAKADGHDFAFDPPVFADVTRYTCRKCGCALLGNYGVAYGSATERPCSR